MIGFILCVDSKTFSCIENTYYTDWRQTSKQMYLLSYKEAFDLKNNKN